MRQPGWEGSLAENGYMYTYGWVPLLFTWNYCNIVSRLYPNTKLKVKRKRLHTPTAGGSGLIPGHKTLHAMWHSQNYKINTWFIVNTVTAHLILLCFAFLVCPVHKYWFFFFFLQIEGRSVASLCRASLSVIFVQQHLFTSFLFVTFWQFLQYFKLFHHCYTCYGDLWSVLFWCYYYDSMKAQKMLAFFSNKVF